MIYAHLNNLLRPDRGMKIIISISAKSFDDFDNVADWYVITSLCWTNHWIVLMGWAIMLSKMI